MTTATSPNNIKSVINFRVVHYIYSVNVNDKVIIKNRHSLDIAQAPRTSS